MSGFTFRPHRGTRKASYELQRTVRSHQCIVKDLNLLGIPIDMPVDIKFYTHMADTKENIWSVSLKDNGGVLGFLTKITEEPQRKLTTDEFPVFITPDTYFGEELWKQMSALSEVKKIGSREYIGLTDARLSRLAAKQIIENAILDAQFLERVHRLKDSIYLDGVMHHHAIKLELLAKPVPVRASGKYMLICHRDLIEAYSDYSDKRRIVGKTLKLLNKLIEGD